MLSRSLRNSAFALCLSGACCAAFSAPQYACVQKGQIEAMPPIIPEAIQIHECSSFVGGPDALSTGKAWCDHVSKVTVGPKDSPPKVTVVDACPTGALAVCVAPFPNSPVAVSRYYYVADPGAGGLEGLRKTCESHKSGHPRGVFTKL
jgi:hypothetical protein